MTGKVRAVASLAAMAVFLSSGQAFAKYQVINGIYIDPGDPTKTFRDKFDECVAKFNMCGLDLALTTVDQSGHMVTIVYKPGGAPTMTDSTGNAMNGVGTDSTIYWDPSPAHQLGDGVWENGCATLYHELTHAGRAAYGKDFILTECSADFHMFTGEANATRAENTYRKCVGLPMRDFRELQPLPPPAYEGGPGKDPCKEPPAEPKCPPDGGYISGSGGFVWVCHGEPHLRTLDQLRYDFHAVGEFVLARSTVDSFEVQIRTAPVYPGDYWTVDSAVTANVAGDHVGVYATVGGPVIRINGKATNLPAGGMSLDHGGVVGREANGSFAIHWPDGTILSVMPDDVWGLDVGLLPAAARAGTLEGLAGNFDGNASNDLRVRGGSVLPSPPTPSDLYPTFADSWRVSMASTLFYYDYTVGETTATFTDSTAPLGPPPVITSERRATAEGVCAGAGVIEPALLDDCVYDVAMTGQASFAFSAAALQQSIGIQMNVAASGTAIIPFFASAGQRVFIDVPSTTLTDNCGILTVLSPSGAMVVNSDHCLLSGKGYWETTALPSTGNYKLQIGPAGAAGLVNVRFYTPEDQRVSATIGGTGVRAAIATPGARSFISFAGTGGESIHVDASASTLSDQCAFVLEDSAGTSYGSRGCISAGAGQLNYGNPVTLPSSGTYYVVFDPDGPAVGQATFSIHH